MLGLAFQEVPYLLIVDLQVAANGKISNLIYSDYDNEMSSKNKGIRNFYKAQIDRFQHVLWG